MTGYAKPLRSNCMVGPLLKQRTHSRLEATRESRNIFVKLYTYVLSLGNGACEYNITYIQFRHNITCFDHFLPGGVESTNTYRSLLAKRKHPDLDPGDEVLKRTERVETCNDPVQWS